MKKTVYLDTTIPNYYFDERESLKPFAEITRRWWQEERHHFDIWILEETLNELIEGIYVYVVKSRRNPVGPTGSCTIFQTGGLGYDFLRATHLST
ncbi:hypothetical protein L0337_15860 [candidate division KSB1 bacterium]|nr:hypothetical protein [candidate division KSB1 bacterium]